MTFERETSVERAMAAFTEQFEKTGEVAWGLGWKLLVDDEKVGDLLDLLVNRDIPFEDICADFSRAIRVNDKDYYMALYRFVTSQKRDQLEDLRVQFENIAPLPLPRPEDEVRSLEGDLRSWHIPLADRALLPEVDTAMTDILQSAEVAELAQLLSEMHNGLRKAVTSGAAEQFLREQPLFWHYYYILKEKLASGL